MSTLNALAMRRSLGRERWSVPVPFGPDGWRLQAKDGRAEVLVTVARWNDDGEWIHASMVVAGRVPTYDELVTMHQAVFGERYAYQVFAPPEKHISIHDHALHLWGRLDGKPGLPDFGAGGSI